MFESFIITFREGVEIALIIGILLVYLEKIGRGPLRSAVYLGLLASMVISVIVALILERLSMDFEIVEGYLMFIAAAFVSTMIFWMWRTSKRIKHDIEKKIDSLVLESRPLWQVSAGIFVFTFLMVAREGIETVIFLRAVSSSNALWGGTLGVGLGIAGAAAFGFLFVKGSVRVDIGRFLKVTAVVLMIFVAQLVVNGVHEFFELGVFPPSPAMMQILGPIVRNNVLFILAIVSIPAIIFIVPGSRQAEQAKPNRRWQIAMAAVSLSVIFFLGFDDIYSQQASIRILPPQKLDANNGVLHIPVVDLLDGELHRYGWVADDGTRIRFFALRVGAGSFATAFDACRACYNYGYYYMKDHQLICSVCEAPSDLSKLAVATDRDEEQSGSMEGMGCAPLYLPSKLDGEFVIVKTEDLSKNKKFFQTSHVDMDYTILPPKK
jgi:FTR1 family protein